MPVEVGLWRIDQNVKKINYTSIESERKLEKILVSDLSILSEDLMLIGHQIPTDYKKYIDMLAIDREGSIVIIELKKHKTPREVVAQIIDYASWVQGLSYDDIAHLYKEKNGELLEEAFVEHFDTSIPDEINATHQMLIVSAELDYETERIINYLSTNFDVPINAVFFRYFKEGNAEFISRSWLIDPNIVEAKSEEVQIDKKQEKWNKQDFVVNFEDGIHRSWEDAVEYGFISAGNGKWYSQTLKSLFVGARVFCMVPKIGYVGIGIVNSKSTPLKDAMITVNGKQEKLLDYSLEAEDMDHDLDDLEKCEYVVGVEWIKTVPIENAFWIKGLKANQNSAYRLRSQYTIEKVEEFFESLKA
ncbi:DUF91 domain-containing protein [Planococcus glaciei]|uniref:DUF91 domain-containing protein n=1 Tax=Planococcus glaciei TaxID=459472 RepID=UPI001C72FC71|nr:DUF91 domain-containing protein [Planococcus glaciei]MBX0314163.1 DUF91 domain-containing protein [Planococcus glaciei]